MADLHLRFNKDMLVLSTPIIPQLRRIGIDDARDNELMLLLEPEVYEESYSLEAAVGAQCIVTDTAFMTPARLAHSRMEARAEDLAKAAMDLVGGLNAQHVLVEIGPCGLPIDPSSKDSLNENRDQYIRAAKTFAMWEPLFDAFFLNGFESCTDLKCALMGMRKVTDKTIIASVNIKNGTLGGRGRESLKEAAAIMAEFGAQVCGFSTAVDAESAKMLAQDIKSVCFLPVLAQLEVIKPDPEQEAPTEENPYFEPDTMVDAAELLEAAGVQFLRAAGEATPSYTGALVAATIGDDVVLPECPAEVKMQEVADLDDLAESLRKRINDALGN